MTWKPGESGNISGRRPLSSVIRDQIRTNAETGVERMRQILEDDEAWGKEGWLTGKEQIAMAALAMDRGYGRAETVSISHTHNGTIGLNVSTSLKQISERLPERMAQQRIIEARAEEAELLE